MPLSLQHGQLAHVRLLIPATRLLRPMLNECQQTLRSLEAGISEPACSGRPSSMPLSLQQGPAGTCEAAHPGHTLSPTPTSASRPCAAWKPGYLSQTALGGQVACL